MTIEFVVHGEAKPQGSKISHGIKRRDGSAVMKNGRVLVVTRDDCGALKNWRAAVAQAAHAAYSGPLLAGPVRLSLWFYRTRPKGHFGTGRNAGVLKTTAPEFPTTKPDTIKVARAVEDSLKAVIWNDDSQVVEHFLFKRWGDSAHVRVVIGTL